MFKKVPIYINSHLYKDFIEQYEKKISSIENRILQNSISQLELFKEIKELEIIQSHLAKMNHELNDECVKIIQLLKKFYTHTQYSKAT